MKTILYAVLFIVLILCLSGCGILSVTPHFITVTPLVQTPIQTSIPTLTSTKTPTPTFTETPTPTEIPVMFIPNFASNCRFGPNENIWDVITILNKGQPVTIVGKSDVVWGPWWKVESPKGECWVYSNLGTTTGDESLIQEGSIPFPAYTPVPTPYVLITITIKNNQSASVCEIDYKRFIGSEDYQKLELAGPIPPKQSGQAVISQDIYNFRFLDCGGNVLSTSFAVFIDNFSTTITTP